MLLEASGVCSTFHELLTAQNWAAAMPTNALLISGPSKSADIEQTLALWYARAEGAGRPRPRR